MRLINYLCAIIIIYFFIGCNPNTPTTNILRYAADSASVRQFIHTGDSIYITKANYTSFIKSLELYDSAYQIANRTKDTVLIAASIFAKGRAFDAMNNNPQKTIDYYLQASELYSTLPNKQVASLYLKHLVAHSYDKVADSVNCVKILHELFTQIKTIPDSSRKQMGFIAEMALISTEIKNYQLADSILQNLTQRQWIKNDSTEYDYLNHYYLTHSRIQVYLHKNYKTPYLDSLNTVFNASRNLSDSMYYSSELTNLFRATGNELKANYFLKINNVIFNKFNGADKVRDAQSKVIQMEVAAIEMQQKAKLYQASVTRRNFYLVCGLLAIISLLTIFLIKKLIEIKRRKNEISKTTEELFCKNIQNELLHKELHHRVKNNLQMIMSLVYMQERKTEIEETKQSLQDIRLRIESIAALHQQMMLDTESNVNLKTYFSQLVNSVTEIIINNRIIITHIDVEDITLPTAKSFPLGLLINEWVTNSIKYAKVPNSKISLYLTAKQTNRHIIINYKDSGIVLQKQQITAGLGTKIINLLTTQLDGDLAQTDNDYFNYTLTIPTNGR